MYAIRSYYAEIDDELVEDSTAAAVDGLPASYNETFIDVILRDPVWAYAFWEIKQSDREVREQDPRFAGYRLRVQPLGGARSGVQSET